MSEELRILIVEDNPADADFIHELLPEIGPVHFRMETVARLSQALARLEGKDFDMVLLDLGLPDSHGLTTLQQLRKAVPEVPVIVLTGTNDQELAVASMRDGAQDYLVKGQIGGSDLARAARYALERQKAAAALRESEDKFKCLFERSSVGKSITLPSGEMQVNQAFCDLLGYSQAELQHQNWSALTHPEDRETTQQMADALLAGKQESVRFTKRYLHKSGAVVWADVSTTLRRAADGQPLYFMTAILDITERRQAEVALRASEQEFRSLAEAMPQIVWVCRPDGGNIYFNQQWVDYTGMTLEESRGPGWNKPFHPDDQQRAWDAWKNATENEAPYSLECRLRRADGVYRWWLVRGVPLRDAHRKILKWFGTCTDIESLKQAEVALRKSEQRYRALVEQSPVSIIITDPSGNIEFVNPKFTHVTGYALAEVLGKNPRLLKSGETSPEDYRQLWETLTAGKEWRGEFHNRRKDGTLFWETAAISPIRDDTGVISHFLAMKEDTSERKLLESKYLRAQRVEAIGNLASGIAHDLNNILTPILICAPALCEDLPAKDRKELARTIETSAQRAVNIVKLLLGFGRGTDRLKGPLQIRHLIREMGKMAGETFPRSIRVTEDCPNDLWPVVGDATQIHQVLLNLCVNARDAMPKGGQLKLSGANVMLDESYVSMHQEATAGPYVLIKVADTGTGISEAVRERMFDPFFTTKSADKGTGLGLTTSLGIVKDHHGFFIIQSQVGQGTTFHIYLPAKPDAQAVSDVEHSHPAIPHGTGQWVLVVDDERPIREVMDRTLRRHGYRVLLAAEGIEALQQFTQASGTVDVVITDMMMPLMDGLTLCRTLQRLNPATPIIFSSGAVLGDRADEIATTLEELGIKHLLNKPYDSKALLHMLHEVLHEKPATKTAEPNA